MAVELIGRIGALPTVWLRLALGALLLLVARPAWRSGVGRDAWRAALLLGVLVGAMNTAFYEAIARIPLGVAVTLEFWGPLAVAVLASRRILDLLWVALAAAGIVLLAGGRLGAGDLLGVGFALASGLCWALFIFVGGNLARAWPDGRGLGVAMAVGAVLVAPAAFVSGAPAFLDPLTLGLGLVVAIFSSVVPYSLELRALRDLAPGVYGVLTSLEPAVGAIVGALLGQALAPADPPAILLVVAASAGASVRAARRPTPDAEVLRDEAFGPG